MRVPWVDPPLRLGGSYNAKSSVQYASAQTVGRAKTRSAVPTSYFLLRRRGCCGVPRGHSATRAFAHPTSESCGSVRLAILAPDAERLLRRAVGDREQHRLLAHLVRIALPGRHDKDIIDAPFERLVL